MERLDLGCVVWALLNFVFERRSGWLPRIWWDFKLIGRFVEISIFREQGECSHCFPKSCNLVVFGKSFICRTGPVFRLKQSI